MSELHLQEEMTLCEGRVSSPHRDLHSQAVWVAQQVTLGVL